MSAIARITALLRSGVSASAVFICSGFTLCAHGESPRNYSYPAFGYGDDDTQATVSPRKTGLEIIPADGAAAHSSARPGPQILSGPLPAPDQSLAARPSPYIHSAVAATAPPALLHIAAAKTAAPKPVTEKYVWYVPKPTAKTTLTAKTDTDKEYDTADDDDHDDSADSDDESSLPKPVLKVAAVAHPVAAVAARAKPAEITDAKADEDDDDDADEAPAPKASRMVVAAQPKVAPAVMAKKKTQDTDIAADDEDDAIPRPVLKMTSAVLPAAHKLPARPASYVVLPWLVKSPHPVNTRLLQNARLDGASGAVAVATMSRDMIAHAGEEKRVTMLANSELASAVMVSEEDTLKSGASAGAAAASMEHADTQVARLGRLAPAAGSGAMAEDDAMPGLPVINVPSLAVPGGGPAIAAAPQKNEPAPFSDPAMMAENDVPLPAVTVPALPSTAGVTGGTPAVQESKPLPAAAPVAPPVPTMDLPSALPDHDSVRDYQPEGLEPESKAIADKLPPEKKKHAVHKAPVKIQHTQKNPLDTPPEGDEVREHEATGISISIRRPRPNINHMLEEAYDALIAGNQEDAIAVYKQVLAEDPKNKLALFGLATTYHRAGQLKLARPLYGRLLAIDPENEEGLNNFLVLLSDESPQQALDEMKRLEATHPDFSPLPAQMAVVYEKMGAHKEAIDSMKHAIDLSPENIKYRYDMAVMLDKDSDWEDAAVFYQQLITAHERGEKIPANPEEIQERLTFIRSNRPSAR